MYEGVIIKSCIISHKERTMNTFINLIQKIFIFEKEPQRIGLTQFKEPTVISKPEPSIKTKNIKLSDLMRRAS